MLFLTTIELIENMYLHDTDMYISKSIKLSVLDNQFKEACYTNKLIWYVFYTPP